MYNYGTYDDNVSIVLEYMNYGNLKQFISNTKASPNIHYNYYPLYLMQNNQIYNKFKNGAYKRMRDFES